MPCGRFVDLARLKAERAHAREPASRHFVRASFQTECRACLTEVRRFDPPFSDFCDLVVAQAIDIVCARRDF